ncbi:DUF6504 family protein [Kribbella solani]|uniref:DUF6504 family protein n=1 Tax=Kribbella solani TaxID=236067 RepID=UPI0029BE7E28|nr:DUF6504 family protein [Kribbella solani]MDX3000233.1 DUF6504 family protein [Kribbella solani]
MWEIDDAVEVHSVFVDGIETPDQFLWRGRLWRVCELRSQWTETAAWWERGVIGTGSTYDAHVAQRTTRAHLNGVAAAANPRSRPAATHPHPAAAAAAAAAAGAAAAAAGAVAASAAAGTAVAEAGVSAAAVGVLDADWGPQRAVYRVEAGCGRHGRRELFDLAHDPHSGRWQLERVTDR